MTDELAALGDALRGALTSRHPLSSGAHVVAAGSGAPAWSTLHELGLTGLGVDDADGGAGGGLTEQVVVLAALARELAPAPYLATVVALSLLPAGCPLRQDVAAGRARLTLAWSPTDVWTELLEPAHPPARLTRGTLTGEARLVLDLRDATAALVVTDHGLAAVAVDSPGVTVRRRSTVDVTRSLDDLVLHEAPATPVLDAGELNRAGPVLRLGTAAEALGVAERCLELAVEHARTREAFGRPIGVHQAISHPLVELYADVELSRSTVFWAASLADASDPAAAVAAASACVLATRAAVRCAEQTVQTLGGIGFTWEHVTHRLYKRALGLSQLAGSQQSQLDLVASEVLG